MSTLTEITDAIAETLNHYGQIRCTDDLASFTPPCVVVDAPELIDFRQDYGGGRLYVIPLLCIVTAKDLRAARDTLHALVESVVATLDDHSDLENVVDTCVAMNATAWQVRQMQDVDCLVTSVRVEILA